MMEVPDTAELLAFTTTIETASLSAAARTLGVPRATIGRRLARLEEKVGTRLLRRTTRALALTDAGEAFYRHARIALDAVAQAEASVRRGDGPIRGTLRVSVQPIEAPGFERINRLIKANVLREVRVAPEHAATNTVHHVNRPTAAMTLDFHDGADRCVMLVIRPHQTRELLDGAMLKKRRYRKLLAEFFLDLCRHAHGKQRMAA